VAPRARSRTGRFAAYPDVLRTRGPIPAESVYRMKPTNWATFGRRLVLAGGMVAGGIMGAMGGLIAIFILGWSAGTLVCPLSIAGGPWLGAAAAYRILGSSSLPPLRLVVAISWFAFLGASTVTWLLRVPVLATDSISAEGILAVLAASGLGSLGAFWPLWGHEREMLGQAAAAEQADAADSASRRHPA
jgi:hypothetical protein